MAGRSSSPAFIDPSRRRARNFRQRTEDAFFATGLYRRMLRGAHPVQIDFVPRELWPGDPKEADRLFRGEFEFAGRLVSAPNGNPWRIRAPSQAWADEIHSFGWLRHFRAAGGDAAQRHVEAMFRSWLEDFDDWHPVAWQPEVIAHRLIAWLTHSPFAASTGDPVYHSAVMNSMARQARHLARTADTARDGLPRLTAAIGLVYSGFCLPHGERRLRKGLASLNRELERQILPDGGIATRSPTQQYEALRILVALHASLKDAGEDMPPALLQAIDRVAPMLRFFRMGDGKLALFNGGFEEDVDAIDTILDLSRAPGHPVSGAVYTGFQRVQAQDAMIIMDSGEPPISELSIQAHAGLNSFEMSVGPDRLITNCGSSEQMDTGDWQRASRTTAAHSTLVIDNRNSSSILENQRMGHRPSQVRVLRDETDESITLDVSHNGYEAPVGLEHNRKLRVRRDGNEIAGTDTLTSVGKSRKKNTSSYDIRFHLHPSVGTSPSVDGGAVELRLPSGDVWQLECVHGLMIEESIYLGDRGNPQRTQQIVIHGTVDEPSTVVRWLLSRLSHH
jgi:uncharacterized heparinase superfamily protein